MKDNKLTDKVRLQHILEAIADIKSYVQQAPLFEEFARNKMMIDACLYKLEIVGEASNRLSVVLQAQYPTIEWAKIVGLRNLIAHEYFKIVPDLIWQIIHHNIPVFEQEIRSILENNE